jgi:hypothetical protein
VESVVEWRRERKSVVEWRGERESEPYIDFAEQLLV